RVQEEVRSVVKVLRPRRSVAAVFATKPQRIGVVQGEVLCRGSVDANNSLTKIRRTLIHERTQRRPSAADVVGRQDIEWPRSPVCRSVPIRLKVGNNLRDKF